MQTSRLSLSELQAAWGAGVLAPSPEILRLWSVVLGPQGPGIWEVRVAEGPWCVVCALGAAVGSRPRPWLGEGTPCRLSLLQEPSVQRGLLSCTPSATAGTQDRHCTLGGTGDGGGHRRPGRGGVPLGSCGQGHGVHTGHREGAGWGTGPCRRLKCARRVPCDPEFSPHFHSFGR